MAASKKGLFRLAILVLVLPVMIVLFLHFFGRNELTVEPIQDLTSCSLEQRVHVLITGEVNSNEALNQLKRINRGLNKNGVEVDTTKRKCLSDTTALLLVNAQNQLMGSYSLDQLEINRFFMEFEIVYLKENYGKAVSR